MNSQNDDYLKHSPHLIYEVTGRGQKENKEFENCNIQYTLFTLSTLSNIYPILRKSGYFSHWTRWLNSFIFITNCYTFSMNTTPIPTVKTLFHKNCLIFCLLTFNKLLFLIKHIFKAKADICFCLHSLKDDVIDDGYSKI